MKHVGLKFSPIVLLLVAKNALISTPHPIFGLNARTEGDNKPLVDRTNVRWVKQFQEAHNIVHHTQTEKLMVSPEKIEFIERLVVFHMRELFC